MTKATWIPERYPASGTIGAAGFYKLLGRPQLDPLTVLVRETAQNSWDAKSKATTTVRFAMHGRDLTESERDFLINSVLTNGAEAAGTGLEDLPLQCQALYVVDRGTVGLGGPFSASEVSESNVYDWVDFILNVGKANTAGHTGGTYGFGKTIAYVVSRVNTVVVYSRAKHLGSLQSRLMACAIGDEFKRENVLFTGRHWWGAGEGDTPVPLVDAEADEIANALGMPKFEGDDTGTTLMIIQPDFGGRTPRQGMQFMVEAALWNLWPKLVDQPSRPPEMDVSFSWNAESLLLPSPESRPPLASFVQAFQGLLSSASIEEQAPGLSVQEIRTDRPNRVVGQLAVLPMAFQERALVDDGSSEGDPESLSPAAMIEGPSHHVALLRSPNLVVEYLEGPPSPEGSFEWAGVFKADSNNDKIFALAEPPTHDTWRPDLISDRLDKSLVKVGLQNIRKALETRWGSRSAVAATQSTSTSAVAHRLAHLVAGSEGTAALAPEPGAGGGGGGVGKRSAAKLQVLASGPLDHPSELRTGVTVLVSPATGTALTQLDATIGIALAGGGVDLNSDGGLRLLSAKWEGSSQALDGLNASILVNGADPTLVELTVQRTTDLSVAFDLQVQAAERGVE